MMQQEPPPPATRWQVFVIGPNDFVRTPAGDIRQFTSIEDAQRTAQEMGGFVQVAGSVPPGGFDRTFH